MTTEMVSYNIIKSLLWGSFGVTQEKGECSVGIQNGLWSPSIAFLLRLLNLSWKVFLTTKIQRETFLLLSLLINVSEMFGVSNLKGDSVSCSIPWSLPREQSRDLLAQQAQLLEVYRNANYMSNNKMKTERSAKLLKWLSMLMTGFIGVS